MLAKKLRKQAQATKKSVSRYLAQLVRRGQASEWPDEFFEEDLEFHDLDHLAGTWTSDEYELFERLFISQRKVDAEC